MNDSYLSQLDFVLSLICTGIKTAENNFQSVESIRKYAETKGLKVTEKEFEALILKLRQDGYVRVYHPRSGDDVIAPGQITDSFYLMATISGLIFNKTGYKKTYRNNKIKEFPKNYWYIIALVSAIAGATFDIWKEALRQIVLPTSSQQLQAIPASADSLQNHKMVHDTIYVDSTFKPPKEWVRK